MSVGSSELTNGGAAAPRYDELLAAIAERAGGLGVELADVDWVVSEVTARLAEQARTFGDLHAGAAEASARNRAVAAAAEAVSEVAEQTSYDVTSSSARVETSLQEVNELVEAVTTIGGSLNGLLHALKEVSAATEAIDAIAKQTHLLALNARIEAARAGSEAVASQ